MIGTLHTPATGSSASDTIDVVCTGIAAGAHLVVFAGCYLDYNVDSVEDDLSAAGIAAIATQLPVNSLPGIRARMFHFENYSGGTRTFTATFSNAAATRRWIAVVEVPPGFVATTSSQGGAGIGDAGEGTDADTGTITPSIDGCYLIGIGINFVDVPTVTGGLFEEIDNFVTYLDGSDPATASIIEYLQPTAAGVNMTWDTGGVQFWMAFGAAYLPGAGGAAVLGTATITAVCEGIQGTSLITVTE